MNMNKYIKIDAIAPTFPCALEIQHHFIMCFNCFNFQPFYYSFKELKNFSGF